MHDSEKYVLKFGSKKIFVKDPTYQHNYKNYLEGNEEEITV